MGRYQDVVDLRQKILDRANKSIVSAVEISQEFGLTQDYAYKTLRKMERFGEVARKGKGHALKFYGIKETTTSASEIVNIAQQRRVQTITQMEAELKETEKVTVVKGSKTIHRGMDRSRPLPGQGGQGAVSGRIGIQSSFQMV